MRNAWPRAAARLARSMCSAPKVATSRDRPDLAEGPLGTRMRGRRAALQRRFARTRRIARAGLCRDAERTLRNQSFRRVRCMWTRTLDAVESSSGGERLALGKFGAGLSEAHPSDGAA